MVKRVDRVAIEQMRVLIGNKSIKKFGFNKLVAVGATGEG